MTPEHKREIAESAFARVGVLNNMKPVASVDSVAKAITQAINEREKEIADYFNDAEFCQCGNIGYFVVEDNDGYPAQEQCEFCYTNEKSFFNKFNQLRKNE